MAERERTWEPVPFVERDLDDLANLADVVYAGAADETANPTFLRWQYFDNPAGPVIAWLARDKVSGRLAGSYSVIPVRMVIGGKDVVGSLSLNTMTHPDYRKQGIFKALAEATYGSCAGMDIPLTIGLPNAESYPGFMGGLKFGDIGKRLLLLKVLRMRNVVRRVVRPSFLAPVAAALGTIPRALFFRRVTSDQPAEEITRFDARFDDLWRRARGVSANIVVRTSDYLNWRFFDCPTRTYKVFAAQAGGTLAGFIVAVAAKQGSATIVWLEDVLIDPAVESAAVWKTLLAPVEAWAATQDADVLAGHLPAHHRGVPFLRKLSYRPVPSRFLAGPHAFVTRVHRPDLIDPAAAMDFSRWYLMDGDNDRP